MNLSDESTSPNPLFLDANVVLEIVLARSHQQKAREIHDQHAGRLHISALTAHLIVHFGQSIVDLPILRQLLQDYTIIELCEADFEWAFINIRGNDYEDALQLAVAIRSGCQKFATFDQGLFNLYKELSSIEVELIT